MSNKMRIADYICMGTFILDSVEELYAKVEREVVEKESQQKRRRVSEAELKNIKCGEELYFLFRDNFDSSTYRLTFEFFLEFELD